MINVVVAMCPMGKYTLTNTLPGYTIVSNMIGSELLTNLLTESTVEVGLSKVSFKDLLQLCQNRFNSGTLGVDLMHDDIESALSNALNKLSESGVCRLDMENASIETIHFDSGINTAIENQYKWVEQNPDIPFPGSSDFRFPLADGEWSDIGSAEGIQELLSSDIDDNRRYRIFFPDGVHSLVATGKVITQSLLGLSLAKLQHYLNQDGMVLIAQKKLEPIVSGTKSYITDTLNRLRTNATAFVEMIENTTDRGFPFWAHLTKLVVDDIGSNPSQNRDHGYYQGAYLIFQFCLHARNKGNNSVQMREMHKEMDNRLNSPPYARTLQELILPLQNLPASEMESLRAGVLQRLKKMISWKGSGLLPEVLRLQTATDQEYFLHRKHFLQLFLTKTGEVRSDLSNIVTEKWNRLLNEYTLTKAMSSDSQFRNELNETVKLRDPLFNALLDYKLLALAARESENRMVADEVSLSLDHSFGKLVPIDKLLKLDRRRLLQLSRRTLPFYKRSWILFYLFRALRQFISPEPIKTKARARKQKSQTSSHRSTYKPQTPNTNQGGEASNIDKIHRLREEFVGEEESVEATLAKLIEQWNPLFEPMAKANLVEDVNSLIRDYLRRLRKGFRISPPDPDRIRAIAKLLSENRQFDPIKKKNKLLNYMETYIVVHLYGFR